LISSRSQSLADFRVGKVLLGKTTGFATPMSRLLTCPFRTLLVTGSEIGLGLVPTGLQVDYPVTEAVECQRSRHVQLRLVYAYQARHGAVGNTTTLMPR